MSRLTNKDLASHSGKINGKTLFDKVYNKLGQIEDLEDELGCPLAVVFKAIKYGVRTKFLDKLNIVSLYYNEEYFLVVFNDFGSNVYVKLKDYKKTWWLSSDLEE